MQGNDTIRADPELLVSDMEGDLLLIDPRTDACYLLSGISVDIWRVMRAGCSIEHLLKQAIPSECRHLEQVQEDWCDLLTRMRESGLVTIERQAQS